MSSGRRLYVPDGAVLEDYFWDRSELSVIQGPIGSGTSTASCHKLFVLACEQEPDFDRVRRTRFIVSRTSYRQLKKTTIKTWLMWFPEHEWGDMVRSEPMSHHLVCDHPSGDGTLVDCEVEFLAIDGPETAEQEAASYEITGFFINEGQFVEKGVVDELLSRCGRYPSKATGPGATWHGGFVDLNAPSEGHWIPYMRGDIPLPSDWAPDQKEEMQIPVDEDGNPAWRFFVQPPGLIENVVDGKIQYSPNPAAENQKHLRKTYMAQARGKPKSWIDQRVLNRVGLYVGGKAVYPTYLEADHASKTDINPFHDLPIIVGLDFGRDPAAVFMQNMGDRWFVLSELIGNNESAQLFAPRVARHLSQEYRGMNFEAWGDPRGADRTQSVETTAYDIFQQNGIRVMPATTDNNPEMRRSTVEKVLGRRNGVLVANKCLSLRHGLAGGYHYKKIKGATSMYSPRPEKNASSHIVEAFENALLGGGEGHSFTSRSNVVRLKPSPVKRPSIRQRS